MTVEKNGHSLLRQAAIVLLPSLAIVAALWLPFGFSMGGLVEEWDLLGLFTEHGPFLMVHLDGPLPAHAIRPFMPLSFALSYLADRDSFDAWHLLTIASLLAKGAATTYLVSRATGSRGWGIVAAALLLLYPADTMQLSLRSIHINVAIALLLTGSALLVSAFGARSPTRAVAGAVVATTFYVVSLGIYEAGLVLIMLPLVVPFASSGLSRIVHFRRRELGLAAIWAGGVCLYLGYAAWASHKVASYQSQVTGGGQGPIATAIAAFPKLFTTGAARALIGGWMDAWRMLAVEYTSYVYFGCAVLGIAAVALFAIALGRSRVSDEPSALPSWRMPARLLLAGLVLMLAGYAPFLTSPYHVVVSQRTFLWATPGAAIAWVGVLLMIWRLARAPAIAGACLLLALGFGAQLFQFHHYVELTQRQRAVLRGIVESSDLQPGKPVVVLDGSNQIGHSWFFVNGDMVRNALSYLYGRAVGPVEVCHAPGMEWVRPDQFGRKGRCAESETGWSFDFPHAVSGPGLPTSVVEPSRHFASGGNVTVVGVRADGTSTALPGAQAERRRALQTGDDVVARRYQGVLAPRSSDRFGPMFRDETVGDSYRWSFGDWWNLDLPTRGSGWREVEWTVNGLVQRSAAWMVSSTADVLFELSPSVGNYRVRGAFVQFASDAVRNGMSLQMNGRPLVMRWVSATQFEADVPPDALVSGSNRLGFVTQVDDKYFGLGGQLDWFDVVPASR
jgi:hypothetical protein